MTEHSQQIQAIQQKYKNNPAAVITRSKNYVHTDHHRYFIFTTSIQQSSSHFKMNFNTAQKELLLEAFSILIQKTILLVAGYV